MPITNRLNQSNSLPFLLFLSTPCVWACEKSLGGAFLSFWEGNGGGVFGAVKALALLIPGESSGFSPVVMRRCDIFSPLIRGLISQDDRIGCSGQPSGFMGSFP